MADGLSQKHAERRLLLLSNAQRLKSAAELLTAEIAAGNPSTSRKVMDVATAGLISVGLLIGPGVSEGVSAALTERALSEHTTACSAVEVVITEAEALESALASEVDASVDAIRADIVRFAELVSRPESDEILDESGFGSPDLGVPNARQRFVYLSLALTRIWEVAALDDISGEVWAEHARIAEDLNQLRQSIEVLAQTDESLYPPQVIRPATYGAGSYGSGTYGSR